MVAITITQFVGENRAAEPKLIPEGQGVLSRNQKPGRGDLRGWRAPLAVMQVPAGRKTIYRMGRDVASDTHYWLSWTSVVHAVRGFDVEDSTERTYYTGDGYPKVTDNLALSGASPAMNPTAHRPMGVPAPIAAPLVSVAEVAPPAGEERKVDAYFYVYTYVNDWGWESAPSPVSSMAERTVSEVATLSGFVAPPGGGFGINRIRVYRTQAGSAGDADFFFLAEAAYNVPSVTDNGQDLGEVLPSKDWLTAPGVAQGGAANYTEPALSYLTPMWNGMLAAITGKSVRFCEAYTPYAWPMAYDVVPADGTPVALGVFGQNLLVLTTGRPVLVAGSSPESMDQAPQEIPQGCIAPRSAVSMGSGVAWASNDGLCWYGVGGARILTAGLMTREDWLALHPETIIGQMYEGLYFGSYEPAPGQPRQGFLISPEGSGIFFLDDGFDAAHFDSLQDQLYLLRGTDLMKWEAGTAVLPSTFKSKVFRQPRPVSLACAEVVATAYPVQFTLWADGVQRYQRAIPSRAPFRLPAGFMASDWQAQVVTPAADGGVQGVVLASSMQELAQL